MHSTISDGSRRSLLGGVGHVKKGPARAWRRWGDLAFDLAVLRRGGRTKTGWNTQVTRKGGTGPSRQALSGLPAFQNLLPRKIGTPSNVLRTFALKPRLGDLQVLGEGAVGDGRDEVDDRSHHHRSPCFQHSALEHVSLSALFLGLPTREVPICDS